MDIKEGFIICDEGFKNELLRRDTKQVYDYTFLTLNALRQKLFGSCKKEALFALQKKYALPFDLAKDLLSYLPYVENKTYNNAKLDSLVSMKRYLEGLDLIDYDAYFYVKLKQFPVTFVNPIISKEYLATKALTKKYTEINEFSFLTNTYNPFVSHYATIDDECLAVLEKVRDLIKKKVSFSQIHIVNLDDNYRYTLARLSKSLNIPIDLGTAKNINQLEIAKKFLALASVKSSFREILEELDHNSFFYSKIMNLIIDFNLVLAKPSDYLDFFFEQFKQMSYEKVLYQEMVETSFTSFTDNDYVFYVNFNLGSSPKISKDDKYLNDYELEEIGLSNSTIRNALEVENVKKLILSTKNLFLSYKDQVNGEDYLPSIMIKQLGLKVIDGEVKYGYSVTEDRLILGKKYSNLIKYKILDNDLTKYDLNFLHYNTYDNSYHQIPKALITNHFANKPLKMAYSNIKTYFQCPFAYFADRILYLNEFKPNMAARLGTYSHAVLEESYQENFVFADSVKKNTLENALDAKDEFYFKQMEDVLKYLIDFNHRHEEKMTLDKIEQELHIVYQATDYSFEGYIDKLLYAEINGEIYAAIMDYKTGKDYITLQNVEDGFHLQLPSYMFLLAKYEPFKNKKIHILGIYLQKVNIISLNNSIDTLAQKEKSFRLQGYTIADKSLIPLIDPNFQYSDYIQGMLLTKDGNFYRYSKVINEDEQMFLVSLVEELLNEANCLIKNAVFPIAPKMINNVNESCTFCKYKDLCYEKNEDLVYLDAKPFPKGKEGE